MLKRAVAVFLLTVCAAGAALAVPADQKDVLVFTNGDQLSGQLLRASGGNVTFKSDMAGEITVPWDKIKELRTNGNYAVLEKGFRAKGLRKLNDSLIPQGKLTVQNQSIAVAQDSGQVATVSTKDADFILDSGTFDKDVHGKAGLLAGWNGGVTAGATVVRATQDSQTYTAGVNLARVTPDVSWLDPHTRDTLDLIETYGKQSQSGQPDIKSSIFHADAEHDLYFSPKMYALGNASFDHNFSQGLQLQQIYGAGVGDTLIKRPNQQLDAKVQIQYETQSFFPVPPATTGANPTQDLVGATVAENYMRKFKAIVLTEQLQFIPAFNTTKDYSAVGELGVAVPVYKRFNFTANVLDNYLNDANLGAKRNSFQLVTGITYKLR